MCAAEDVMEVLLGGDEGVPEEDVLEPDFSLADVEGIGSH